MKEIYGYRISDVAGNEIIHWFGGSPIFVGDIGTDMEFVYMNLIDEEFNDALDKAEEMAFNHGFMFDFLFEDQWKEISPIKDFFRKLFKRKK